MEKYAPPQQIRHSTLNNAKIFTYKNVFLPVNYFQKTLAHLILFFQIITERCRKSNINSKNWPLKVDFMQ